MSIAVEKGLTDEAHPELFDERAMPPQSAEKKPGQQPDHVIKQYFEKVYKHFFSCKYNLLDTVQSVCMYAGEEATKLLPGCFNNVFISE